MSFFLSYLFKFLSVEVLTVTVFRQKIRCYFLNLFLVLYLWKHYFDSLSTDKSLLSFTLWSLDRSYCKRYRVIFKSLASRDVLLAVLDCTAWPIINYFQFTLRSQKCVTYAIEMFSNLNIHNINYHNFLSRI